MAKKQTKKETPKNQLKQVEIKGKAIGRNVILEIDGEKYSRAFKDKAEREKILADVAKFNNKNNATLKKALIKKMETPAKTRESKTKKIEKVTAKAKTPRTKPEATKAKVKEEKIKEAKELLEKENYNVSKTVSTPRRGEY
jgi:hypothetical protein